VIADADRICDRGERRVYRPDADEEARESGTVRTPIVAVTANAMKGEEERCLTSGMDACLVKPVSIERLRATLERWLSVQAESSVSDRPDQSEPTAAAVAAARARTEVQGAPSAAYAAGLRVSEVVALKVSDINSERLLLRINGARAARIALRCSRRSYWSCCATGIASPGRRSGCSPDVIRCCR
jgi:integrase